MLKNIFRSVSKGLGKHGPAILTGIGITGMAVATVLAIKSTPKAVRLIEEKKKADDVEELTKKEMSDIQSMVSTADKAAVLSICKSAATSEDRKEIKEMIEAGSVDYGRIQSILSARLTADQKAQIYSYYEKYAKIYFGVE